MWSLHLVKLDEECTAPTLFHKFRAAQRKLWRRAKCRHARPREVVRPLEGERARGLWPHNSVSNVFVSGLSGGGRIGLFLLLFFLESASYWRETPVALTTLHGTAETKAAFIN